MQTSHSHSQPISGWSFNHRITYNQGTSLQTTWSTVPIWTPRVYGRCPGSAGVTYGDGQGTPESPSTADNIWEIMWLQSSLPNLYVILQKKRGRKKRPYRWQARSQRPAKEERFTLKFKMPQLPNFCQWFQIPLLPSAREANDSLT